MTKAIAVRALKFFLAPFVLCAIVLGLFWAWRIYSVRRCAASGGSCSIVVTRASVSWGDALSILLWYAIACFMIAWLWEILKRRRADKG